MPAVRHPDPAIQRVIDRTLRAGQGHVFRWWDEIGEAEKNRLLTQLSSVDFTELRSLYRRHMKGADALSCEIEPADVIPAPTTEEQLARFEEIRRTGERAISAGEVAAFVVAGGQATRLGIEFPKGALEITPIKEKSIFEHHVEKIRALSKRHGSRLPFYIMTSETNDGETREFFEKNNYFRLDPADVFFFKQEMMPALDFDGKLVMDAKDHIFTSPNGHGGSITALKNSGALDDMKARGIKHIFYFQVDNILINMADPLFLGYHIKERAEMSAKVAPKRDPEEKVGVVCHANGAVVVIEYSDLPDEYRYATDGNGFLKFSAGNLAIHILDVDFVQRLNAEKHSMPFHIAEKPIPYLNEHGQLVKPKDKNGLKFELFVFDALCRAKKTIILEVNRNEEFAPIKNREGEDTPDTAKDLLVRFYAKWLEDAGVKLPRGSDGRVDGLLEVSPLFALDAEELKRKLPPSFKPKLPLYLGPE